MFHLSIVDNIYDENKLLEFEQYLQTLNFPTAENNKSLYSINIFDENIEKKYVNYYTEIITAIESLVKKIYLVNIILSSNGIVRYEIDQSIGIHRDWEPDDKYVIINNKPKVDLGSVFYLNDNYDGGEIVFFKNKECNSYLEYKPCKNSLIIFDSGIYHLTKPIINGYKVSLTSFYTLG